MLTRKEFNAITRYNKAEKLKLNIKSGIIKKSKIINFFIKI